MSAFGYTNNKWLITSAMAFFAVSCLVVGSVDAKKRKRRKKPVAAKINSAALGELMGPYQFGMSKEAVLQILGRQLKEKYKEKIKETTDVYRQDALRREQKAELAKIKKSYTEFTGKRTGWDVSIIDDQFAHKTGEAMLVYWENNADGKDQRRFFFFHEGELYKMFITLDSTMLPEGRRNFDTFKSMMVSRYGQGNLVTRTKSTGETVPELMDWRSKSYHVQAIDKASFYGSFVLVVAKPSVEKQVELARDANKKEKKENNIINSMLQGDDDSSPGLDSNKAAVDSMFKN